ncbi:MAG: TonB-dependent receptor [Sphingomonadaceae bacterium]|nr:TonB-dependent receptor [Sphingomonadaceae bacterium]
MNKHIQRALPVLLVSTSFAALTPAHAQEQTSVGLDEIVVTARKRAENLQDVSSSISAMSATELARRFDVDVRDFANSSPNVVIDDTQQGPGGVAAVTIRGIGVADVEKSVDPAVGVVIDDIYVGTSTGGLIKAIDLDRVEVLRGPQGTLFGRNAIGGVINLARSRPTQELTGKFRGTYANHDSLDLEGLVSFGLSDAIAVKLTAAHRKSDGYMYNATFGKDGQTSEFTALGVQVLITPTDNLEFSFSFDDQNTKQDPGQLLNLAKSTDLFCAVYEQCAQGVGVPQSGSRYVSLGNGRLGRNGFFDMNLGIAKAKWDISDDFELQYIYGRLETDEDAYQDWDGTALTLFHTDRPARYHQDTHELRLTKANGPLTFVVGGYLWDSAYTINLVSYIGFAVPDTILAIPQDVRQTTKSYAGFFEADYRFTDALKLTVGGRYTKDKKTSGVLDGTFSTWDDPRRESWSKFTPKASLSYDVNDDLMVYGLFSRGYRGGGFNGRPSTLSAATVPYDPETVDNFELGFKSEMLDRRLRLNVSAFLMKYDDKQEDVDVPTPGIGTGRENRTLNAASAEMKGIEADLTAQITENFTLSANLGYLDAKYKDFLADTNNDGVVDDNSALKLRRAPKWTWAVSANYEAEIGPGTGWIQADLHYLGAHEITFLNNPAFHNKAQYLMDASLNYRIDRTQISVFGRNLFKEDGWTIGYDAQGLWSYGAARPSRTYGVSVTQSF